MRFLIIDESSEYRRALASMLRSRWLAAGTVEWDPRRQGHPGRVLEVLATPRYISPEQCLGAPADHRSDLYSLGVIFYEMLAGRKLFEGESAAGLLYMHVSGDVPRLPAKLAGYQPIVDRLLAKQPQDRYQSARELFASIAI